MLSIYLERLDFVIEQEQKEQREKQRVAGAVSVIGGMMLVILLYNAKIKCVYGKQERGLDYG